MNAFAFLASLIFILLYLVFVFQYMMFRSLWARDVACEFLCDRIGCRSAQGERACVAWLVDVQWRMMWLATIGTSDSMLCTRSLILLRVYILWVLEYALCYTYLFVLFRFGHLRHLLRGRCFGECFHGRLSWLSCRVNESLCQGSGRCTCGDVVDGIVILFCLSVKTTVSCLILSNHVGSVFNALWKMNVLHGWHPSRIRFVACSLRMPNFSVH